MDFPSGLNVSDNLGGIDSKLLDSAKGIWSMLDDMADNDPDAYKRFIDKQLKEGREAMKDAIPQCAFCIKSRVLFNKDVIMLEGPGAGTVRVKSSLFRDSPLYSNFSYAERAEHISKQLLEATQLVLFDGQKLFLNVYTSEKVRKPAGPNDSVSIVVHIPYQEMDKKKMPIVAIDIVLNNDLVREVLANETEKITLENMIIDCVEANLCAYVNAYSSAVQLDISRKSADFAPEDVGKPKGLVRIDRKYSLPKRRFLYVGDAKSFVKSMDGKNSETKSKNDTNATTPEGIKLPASCSFGENWRKEDVNEQAPKLVIPGNIPESNGNNSGEKKRLLIEEISSNTETDEQESESLPKPSWKLAHSKASGKDIVVVVLPQVEHLEEVELDISTDQFTVYVPGKYRMSEALPYPVNEDVCKAKWNSSTHTLKMHLVPRNVGHLQSPHSSAPN
eukprot:Nk52_evm5s16 gene=Nk52_evmTU5s16